MTRFRAPLCALALLCAVSPAVAQTPAAGPRTCDEAALRTLAAEPGRVSREGGRVSLVAPAGMREGRLRTPLAAGNELVLSMSSDSGDATVLLAFMNEVPHVETRAYQDRWTRNIEGGNRRSVRWIQRQVLELQGGVRAYGMEYVKDRNHAVTIVAPYQGRTLFAIFINMGGDPRMQAEIEKSVGTLAVHNCAPAAGSAPAVVAAADAQPDGGSGAVCEVPALQAHLAGGDPRRVSIAEGRISLVPADSMDELTSVELGRVVREGTRPALAFTGDSAVVWMQFLSTPSDVSSPAFRASMERWLGALSPEQVGWVSREVVEQGGARWLRMEFTYKTRGGADRVGFFYATPFQGRTLTARLVGPPGTREALARSAATLEARDCRVSRPLWAWVDSAAVARAAAALPAPQLPADMKPLFRVTFDTTGVVESVEPVFEQVPADYAEPVVAALRAALKPQPRSRRATQYLVRVVGGAQPLVDSPELIERMPEIRDPMVVGQQLGNLRRTLMFRPGTSRRAARGFYVRMRVLPDGKVDRTSVQLTRGTEVDWLDEQILSVARSIRFRPGEVDGFAARTWVVLPMSLF
jgi:hypothetical protein